jgi:hypothetical protein
MTEQVTAHKIGAKALAAFNATPLQNDEAKKQLSIERINQRKNKMRVTVEEIERIANSKRYIEGLAYAGHHAYIFGDSGSFKTTFITALCLKALDEFENLEIHYWGFDVSPYYTYAVVKEIAHPRFLLFSNLTINDLRSFYADYLKSNISLDNVIIVLDTFKFLSSDVNNKNANKDAMHFIKNVCKLGASWISIGHTNKDGKRESGTAEIEQDSDGILRIDSVIENSKALATIKNAGRCRWGETKITLETIIPIDDKAHPYLFWYQTISRSRVIESIDIENRKLIQAQEHDLQLIAEIIKNYHTKNNAYINKSTLKASIIDHDFITISARQIGKFLQLGVGKYWKTEKQQDSHNRQLFIPLP